MPAKPTERQYRALSSVLTPKETRTSDEEQNYIVRGYASTFDDPYALYEDCNGNEYTEVVSAFAFEDTDISDVIMQYDHEGRVYARTSNQTLTVVPDDYGLYIEADLSTTAASRELYEEIAAGLITKMSWAFTVDDFEFDEKTRTTTLTKIRKIYDVSAVSYPADPNTSISARNLLAAKDGDIARLVHMEYVRRARAVAIAKAKKAIFEERF